MGDPLRQECAIKKYSMEQFRLFPALARGVLWFWVLLIGGIAPPDLLAVGRLEGVALEDSVARRLSEALGVDLGGGVDLLGVAPPFVAYRPYAEAAAALAKNRGEGAGGAVLTQEALGRIVARLQEALDEAPDFAAARYLMGLMDARRRRYSAALANYRAAARHGPAFAEAGSLKALFLRVVSDCQTAARHVARGTQYLERKKVKEALSAYRSAVRLMPDFAEAHANLGLVYMLIGNYARAVAEQQEAIRLKPDLAEAHYNLGNVYVRQGRYAEAAPAYREAIRLKPDDAPPDSVVAGVDAHQGAYTQRVARHQRATRRSGLANAYFNLRDYAAARAEYEQVLGIAPDFADAHYNLAILYERIGDTNRAVVHWQAYLKLAEGDPAQKGWIPEARARLDRLVGQGANR